MALRRLCGAFVRALQLPAVGFVEGSITLSRSIRLYSSPPIMFSLPVPRTSFLDSRFRLRGRVNRLLAHGQSVSDNQLDSVAHVGRPGAPLTARPATNDADRDRIA